MCDWFPTRGRKENGRVRALGVGLTMEMITGNSHAAAECNSPSSNREPSGKRTLIISWERYFLRKKFAGRKFKAA